MFKKTLVAVSVLSALSVSQSVASEQRQITSFLTKIGAPAAWNRGITGQGSVVAVIDNGFDLTHADLRGQVLEFRNFQGGRVENWAVHGTQMASIVAGARNGVGTVGVAPDARLLLAQVGFGGTNTYFNMTAMRSAMTWADQKGAHVVNISASTNFDTVFRRDIRQLAQPGVFQAPATYGSLYGQSQTTLNQFAAANKNSVIVAAAGNQGLPYAAFPGAFATQVDSQGKLLLGGRMLIVGSVNSRNTISTFSNRAGHICTRQVSNFCLDPYRVKDFFVVAPGESVTAATANQIRAGDTAGVSTGTSPAAAMVSGGMALMKQAWPQLRANQMVTLVLKTARDLGAPGPDEVYGHGLVDFDRATQPQGRVVYTPAILQGTAVSGTAATASVRTSSTVSSVLQSSDTLKRVQVVDSYGRNYTADFTRAISLNANAAAVSTSPFLALSGNGYREATAAVDQNLQMTVMGGDQGMALQFDSRTGPRTVSYQMGSMRQQDGFLDNYSQGLMGFGHSTTTWAMIGATEETAQGFGVTARLGVAVTDTGRRSDSLVSLSPKIYSDTWSLGVFQRNLLLQGRQSDQLSLQIQAPVAVRRGSATVTAVTGYSYEEDTAGEYMAIPEIESETLSLRSAKRPMDLVLAYSADLGRDSEFGLQLIRQFNRVGSMSPVTDTVSVKYTKRF